MYKAAHISRFNIEYLAWRLDNVVDSILPSVKTHGFLSPITCIEFNNERYIVDGLKRYQVAKALGIAELPYIVISPDIVIVDVIKELQAHNLNASIMHRLRFINAIQLPFDLQTCQSFQLPFYSHLKKDVSRILDLPDHAQLFLHQKGFSLKEIVNLLHYSKDAFHQLLNDDRYFQFTKRTFDEALSLITALTKRHNMALNELLEKSNYNDLKLNNMTPQQRQKTWLSQLNVDANPVLLASQQKIDALISDIQLPAQLTYDRSLEHTGISIHSTVQTHDQLNELTAALATPATQQKIREVMDLI